MKKHKNKIIAAFFIVIVLAFAFWYGGNSPGFKGGTYDTKQVNQAKQDVAKMPQSAMVTDKTDENSITNNQAVVINEEAVTEKNQGGKSYRALSRGCAGTCRIRKHRKQI